MANDGNGRILAVKVVHKDKQYRRPDGRKVMISEKRILEKVAFIKRPFLTPLLDSWADEENVYFVMVSRCYFMFVVLHADSHLKPFYYKTLHDLMRHRRVTRAEFKPYIAQLVRLSCLFLSNSMLNQR